MNLDSSLSNIKGVGPKTAEKLALAGFSKIDDLINFLPRAYEDFSSVVKIADLKPGKVTIKARAEKVSTRRPRWRMAITEATLRDESGAVRGIWFNQYYRQSQLESGEEFYFSGVFEFARGRYQITNPSSELVKDLPVQTGRVLPVYPTIKGLKPALTRSVLDKIRPIIIMLDESLPKNIIKSQKLLSKSEAMTGLHFPSSLSEAESSRERLAFEELFELLLASRLNKQINNKLEGFSINFNQPKIKEIVDKLPFTMTGSQKRALWDVLQDFEKSNPMNRMLQGDVGSGKTVVAGLSAYQASLAGYQSAIMAPTEILATQHAKTLDSLLKPFGINMALLTGSTKGKSREELYKKIKEGEVDIVVGTHALFQPDVFFKKLGFVVIDEQHRFGVKQRQMLLDKSEKMPHLLSMTATPIPRSLQLTLFGDLDISVLNELPKGRRLIETKIFKPINIEKVYHLITDQLKLGHQAYIVMPLIEESITKNDNKIQKKAVEVEYEKIKKVFKKYKVGLLHGKMKAEEKEKIMGEFAKSKIDILVSTTVIEVGVDIPNATVMCIENADQFGLSQLHQLRGRVGRSDQQSYCYLILSDDKPPTRRLKEIEKSNDGFYLSEVDLKMRGPGEIYGLAQHGELDLRIASLTDSKLIKRAANEADNFIQNKCELNEYPILQQKVKKYQRLTTLN